MLEWHLVFAWPTRAGHSSGPGDGIYVAKANVANSESESETKTL